MEPLRYERNSRQASIFLLSKNVQFTFRLTGFLTEASKFLDRKILHCFLFVHYANHVHRSVVEVF